MVRRLERSEALVIQFFVVVVPLVVVPFMIAPPSAMMIASTRVTDELI